MVSPTDRITFNDLHLYRRHTPAIAAANRFRSLCKSGLCIEDLIQTGITAIERNLNKFDEKICSWGRFAYREAARDICREVQKSAASVRTSRNATILGSVSLDREKEDGSCLGDSLSAPASRIHETLDVLRQLKGTPARDVDVFTDFWFEGFTAEEIGKRYGIGTGYVQQILYRIRKFLVERYKCQ